MIRESRRIDFRAWPCPVKCCGLQREWIYLYPWRGVHDVCDCRIQRFIQP